MEKNNKVTEVPVLIEYSFFQVRTNISDDDEL